ncbi:Hypothetical protein MSYG_1160 [Malassezia sympodialis ATCC 42132]|uniref:Uncharacterized protein n=1 Tax=Malassezia sympodialis (strain ATCC 42132) TaxID=1230383 RepID=A0A1M8A346_MALS4|nr:Hypothetical protein MSYG_1160 [Malassezia sympodialis ATCC 42132]
MAEWDADIGLGWPPTYCVYIRLYGHLFLLMTAALFVRMLLSRTRVLHAYAVLLSAVCAAAMLVRIRTELRPMVARALDLASAELTLGLCMLLLYRMLLLLERTTRRAWPMTATWRQYLVFSHLAWVLTTWTAYTRFLHTIVFLLLCVQWGIYAVALAAVQRHWLRGPDGASALPERAPFKLALTPHALRSLLCTLNFLSLMCVQVLFLVIFQYAEELRDFHTWIVVTTRSFSLVFLGLALLPGILPRFDATFHSARTADFHDPAM